MGQHKGAGDTEKCLLLRGSGNTGRCRNDHLPGRSVEMLDEIKACHKVSSDLRSQEC